MTSNSRRLAGALLVALALQAVLWFLPPGPSLKDRVLTPIGDAAEYHALAASLAERTEFSREAEGFERPEIFRTPGYPVLLAGLRLLFGDSLLPILGFQLLLSLLTLIAVRQLALELGLSERAAGLAALLLAASPNLAFHATKAVTETTFTLLLTVCLLLMARFRKSGSLQDIAGAGLVAGLLMLTRPIALYWPLAIGAWAGWTRLRTVPRRSFGHSLPAAVLPILAALLVTAPWVGRNYRTFGRPILSTAAERNIFLYNAATVVAAKQGITLAEARDLMQTEARQRFGVLDPNDEAGYWQHLGIIGRDQLIRNPVRAGIVQLGGFVTNFVLPASVAPLLSHSGAPASNELHIMQQALGLASRGRIVMAWRTVRQSRLDRAGPFFWCWFAISALHLVLLVALAAAGLRMTSRPTGGSGSPAQELSVTWLLLPVLYFTLLTGPVGEPRFRTPVEPALAVLAAVSLTRRRRLFIPDGVREPKSADKESGAL